jgi:hypothetical protein
MQVATQVAAFEGEVGGDEKFVALGRTQDGTIVADAKDEMAMDTVPGCSPFGPDTFDQRQLTELILHGEPSINQARIARHMQRYQGKKQAKRLRILQKTYTLISAHSYKLVCVPFP